MARTAFGSWVLGFSAFVAACGGSSTGSSGGQLRDSGTGGSGSVRECTGASDCRATADYCERCNCVALGPNERVPACTGQTVQCLMDPCNTKVAECVDGQCVISGDTQCAATGESCASGQACCGSLTCCSGVPITPGNEYCSDNCPISDRNIKEGFSSVDPQQILQGVVSLPISRWNYITEGKQAEHLGPMAQDFKARFGLGASDKTILQVDADGVALAAIQALDAKVEKLMAENAALRARVDELSKASARNHR